MTLSPPRCDLDPGALDSHPFAALGRRVLTAAAVSFPR